MAPKPPEDPPTGEDGRDSGHPGDRGRDSGYPGDRDRDSSYPGDPDRDGAPGRRHDLRVPIDADVRVIKPVEAEGVVLNASVGGLRIAADKEVPVGETCTLEVWTDGEFRKRLRGVVVWAKEHTDGWVLGIDASLPESEGEPSP